MRIAVVGAGPVGLFCGMALARKGHEVVVVDRDPPPPPAGEWDRRGVMQFKLPHTFRHLVRRALLDHVPEVWDAAVAAGALPALQDGFPEELTGLQSRRSVFERAFWSMAAHEPGLSLREGHAETLISRDHRVAGVVVDGSVLEADVVIVAAGRTARLGDDGRAPGVGGLCGFSYAARMYRARDGVEPPRSAVPMGAIHRGYLTIVFPQDDKTLSALFVRPSSSAQLAELRHNDKFEAAARAVPNLAPWTDRDRFEPIGDVLAGNGLSNTYRGQLDDSGRSALAGAFFLGDAVCTTNPMAGRGVSLGLRQAIELMRLLDAGGGDYRGVAEGFDAWCTQEIRPWFDDHVHWDATLLARLGGEDIDVEAPLSSDVICAAGSQDPGIMPVAGPFMGMLVPPTALRAVEDRARAVLRAGWRPPFAPGPTTEELGELLCA